MEEEPLWSLGLFLRCLLDFFLGCAVPSAVGTAAGFVAKQYVWVVVLVASLSLIMLVWMISRLFEFRLTVPSLSDYYAHVFSAMLVFCVSAVGFAAALRVFHIANSHVVSKIFTFLFFNFKGLHFFTYRSNAPIGILASTALTAAFLLAVTAVFPLVIYPVEPPEEELPELKKEP